MIKGVSKSILEINPDKSQNQYFEKAILILKDGCENISENELKFRAELMLGNKPPKCVSRKKLSHKIQIITAGVLGAFISAVLLLIVQMFV